MTIEEMRHATVLALIAPHWDGVNLEVLLLSAEAIMVFVQTGTAPALSDAPHGGLSRYDAVLQTTYPNGGVP